MRRACSTCRTTCESQGDTLEVDLITYGSKQFEQEELDVALAELTVGPAFDMGRFGIDNAALGIYGIGSGVVLGEDFYSAGVGAGTRFVIRPNPATYLTGGAGIPPQGLSRQRTVRRRPACATATSSGPSARHLYPLADHGALRQRLSAAGLGRRDYLSYLEGGFTVGPRYSFASPVAGDMLPWIAALNTGAMFRNYDDPDPMIDPSTPRGTGKRSSAAGSPCR